MLRFCSRGDNSHCSPLCVFVVVLQVGQFVVEVVLSCCPDLSLQNDVYMFCACLRLGFGLHVRLCPSLFDWFFYAELCVAFSTFLSSSPFLLSSSSLFLSFAPSLSFSLFLVPSLPPSFYLSPSQCISLTIVAFSFPCHL
jgi:hypothetical protein